MVDRRSPGLSPYRAAQVRARQAQGVLRRQAGNEVVVALRRFADDLQRGVARLPVGERGALEAASVIRRMADDLERALTEITGRYRGLAFKRVQEIWSRAGARVAAASEALGAIALAGGVPIPAIETVAAFETVGGAHHWRTLIQRYVGAAAESANSIVREGLVRNISPEVLARRLRPYISGAEPFHQAFGGLEGLTLTDLRQVNPNAAGALRYNTRRIAISETHNARFEAEVQSFARDPFVRAVFWRLAPDRGALDGPDECDVLAAEDFYGLGPGTYPVDKVPAPPHPFDRCETVPATQDEPAPKPRGIPLQRNPARARVPGEVTRDRAGAIRERAARALREI